MTIRCDGCRHWEPEKADDPDIDWYWDIKEIGECKKAIELHYSTEYIEDKNTRKGVRKVIGPAYVDQMLFCDDVRSEGSSVWTSPAFFCAHHEPVNEGA